MKAFALIPLLAALALTGCRCVPPQAMEGVVAADKVIVLERGIHQIRDEDSGERYYVVCEACARPTLKTRYQPPTPVVMVKLDPSPVTSAVVVTEPQTEPPAPVPDEPKSQAAAYKRLVPFGFGRARLGPQGMEAMAALLEEAKAAERVHVRGYTDIIGDMPGNKRLAMARAAEIRAFLIKGGVDEAKLTTSYCIDCFVESNESDSGRAANRRAVVVMRPAMDTRFTIDLDHRDPCRTDAVQVAAVAKVNSM
ncbi:MAG: OmpA family protein [Hydrogenophilales bacterium]|nr:OmpA family protein [Hydrogenophilales bacterium]